MTKTHVLIAVDDTEASIDAAKTAKRLFGEVDYTVLSVQHNPVLLTAVDPIGLGAATFLSAADLPSQTDLAARAAEVAAEIATEAHIATDDLRGAPGDPGQVILDVAQREAVDVIVVGTHDRGVISRLFEPSVTDHLVHHAHCPVLVVR